jgi:hypothetical protein
MTQGAEPQTLCFDLDNTLCRTHGMDYEASEPFDWAIERVNRLAAAGHTIVIMTARGSATGIDWEPVTRAQLERWGVTYHELRFGKPPAEVFIDDRAVHNVAWQLGDGFSPPLAGPALLTSVVEVGRTIAGATPRLDQHAERAIALARGAGIRSVPAASEIEQAVTAALPAGEGDVTYAIRISEPGGLDVTRRPVSEGAAGVPPDASGAVIDGRIVLWDLSPVESVRVRWVEELAQQLGLSVEHREPTQAEVDDADETFVIALPSLIGNGGPVAADLREAAGIQTEVPASP